MNPSSFVNLVTFILNWFLCFFSYYSTNPHTFWGKFLPEIYRTVPRNMH